MSVDFTNSVLLEKRIIIRWYGIPVL